VSGRPALTSDAQLPRVLVVEGDAQHEVFDVVEAEPGLIRVRSAFLFELGEELRVRLVQAGRVLDATARVRAHTGPSDDRVTELEISEPVPAITTTTTTAAPRPRT
jgi:hypothetical protein